MPVSSLRRRARSRRETYLLRFILCLPSALDLFPPLFIDPCREVLQFVILFVELCDQFLNFSLLLVEFRFRLFELEGERS